MSVIINTSLQNRQADSVGNDLNLGIIDIRTGSKPGPDDAPTGTLLVSFTLPADAYLAAASGEAALNGTMIGVAVATGIAGYAQQRNAANTRWMYGDVGTDIVLSQNNININDILTVISCIIRQPSGV